MMIGRKDSYPGLSMIDGVKPVSVPNGDGPRNFLPLPKILIPKKRLCVEKQRLSADAQFGADDGFDSRLAHEPPGR